MKFTKRQLTTMVVAGLMGTAFAGASFAADASSSAADLLAMNQDRTAAPDTEKIKTLEAQIAQVQQEIAAANAWWEKNSDIIDSYEDGGEGPQADWIAIYNKYKPIHDKGAEHLKQLQAELEAAKTGGTVPVAPQPGYGGTSSGSGETAPSPEDMKRSLSLAQENVQRLQELTARVNREVTEATAAAAAAPKDETAQARAENSKKYAEIVKTAMEAAKQAVTKWQQQLKVEVKDESKPFTMPSPAVETGTDIGQLQQAVTELRNQLPKAEERANQSQEELTRSVAYTNNGPSTEVLLRYLQDTQKVSDLQAAIKAKEARISALSSGTGSTPGTGKEETKPHTGEPGTKPVPQPPEAKVDPVQPGGGTSQGTVTPETVTQWAKLKAEAEAAEQYYNSEVWAKTYFEEMDKKDPYQNWEKEKAHVDGYIANAKAVMEAKQKALESYAKEKGITADPRTKEAQEAALKKKIAELKEAKQNAANFDEKNDAYAKDLGHWWTFEDAKQKNKLAERQAYVEALQRKEAGVLDTQLQQAEDALKTLNSSGTVTPPPAPKPPKPKVDPGQPGSEPGSKPAPQPPQPKVDPAQPGGESGGKTDPQPSAQERQQAEADYKTYINTDEPSLKTLVAWEEEETAQAKEQAEKAGASAEDKQYYEYAKQFQERARQQLAAKQKAIGELKAKYGFKDLQPAVPPAEKKKEYTGDNDTKLSAMQKDLEALRATAQQQQQALQKNGTSYGTVGAVLTTAPDKVDMNLRRQYLQAKQTAKTAQQQYKALLADTNTLRKAMHKEELVENLAQPIFTADGQVNPSVLKGSSSGQPVPTPAENAQVQANSRRIADNTAKIAALDKRVTQVAQDVKKVGARAAALAGLRPVDDGTAKFSLAAATGGYKGENAVAMGLFYRPNKDVLISAGSTIGGDTAYNVGISFKVGTAVVHEKMGTSTPTVQEFYTVVETLQRHIAALEYKVRQMENRQTPERHR
ncbi:hypothetical protein HMPREF3033_00218 [Veillonellaceae bacterium DNF00751]|nr:hypothetical protein HMPREF3033_00218 [Veillonellaceae bacterium DNF00751]